MGNDVAGRPENPVKLKWRVAFNGYEMLRAKGVLPHLPDNLLLGVSATPFIQTPRQSLKRELRACYCEYHLTLPRY